MARTCHSAQLNLTNSIGKASPMLKQKLLSAERILILEPPSPLKAADFEAVAHEIDPDLAEHDTLAGGIEPTTTTKENSMQIQLSTDGNIDGHEALATQVSSVVESGLKRFSDHITRVEVHLSDESSDKKGGNDDMRCVMEARLEGRQPIAVTNQAATLDEAVDGAAGKLTSVIESTLGRLRDHRASQH